MPYMRTQSYILAATVVALVLGAVGYAVMTPAQPVPPQTPPDEVVVTSFEECATQAGNVTFESDPRVCRTKNGQSFTEIITTPPPPPLPPAGTVSDVSDLIVVDAPSPNATITSPLLVKGKARGTWYFEASFPLELIDANGKQLVMMPVHADGDWMTENFVPFSGTLTWATSTTPTGTLIFHRDNPSGLPEHDKEIRVPVILQ